MSYELKSLFATLPKTVRGQPIVINGDPKGKNFLYTNGSSVIIRDIENPAISDIYTEHSAATTCARYSPSGFYIASADVTGKVRIWDTVNKEHILKNEFQPISGHIKDLSWTSDSQRIAVCGEGREKMGHVFNAETGTSVGQILGHSRRINSLDFKPSRPFRLVTAADDNNTAFFHGPPFNFQFTMKDHTRFVNSVRYSPDGSVFITGGADGLSVIYDGTSGEKKGQLGDPAHKGGIYALSFSADSKQVLTASGDKTCKIWDIESSSVVTEFKMGTEVDDMQVGCLWQGDYLLSVSLSGHINYLDKNNPSQPWRIIKGHNKPITSMAVGEDRKTIFTGASDGQICYWNSDTGASEAMPGKGHSNQVQDMVAMDGKLVTVGMDDCIIVSDAEGKQYGSPVKLPSQAKGVSTVSGGLTVAACYNDIVVLRGDRVVFTQKAMYEPTSASIHPGMLEVAIGGSDNRLHIYSLNSDTLTPKATYDHTGAVLDVKYSPDGALLATCDGNRRVQLYSVPDYGCVIGSEWVHHTARVNTASWTSDSQVLGTGALDTNLITWDVATKKKVVKVAGAHPMSQITKVAWLDNNTLVSVGQDSNLKQWSIKHA